MQYRNKNTERSNPQDGLFATPRPCRYKKLHWLSSRSIMDTRVIEKLNLYYDRVTLIL